MSYLGTKLWLAEIEKGLIAGHRIVHRCGRNDMVPNGTWAFITLLGHTDWPLSSPTTVRVKAGGNAADAAGGAGARKVLVSGIDDNFLKTEEEIVTAGASVSAATTTLFWRVDRVFVPNESVGTYGGSNSGDITIESSSGVDLIKLDEDEGVSQFGGYTTQSGETAHLLGAHVTVDSIMPADVRLITRQGIGKTSAPMSPKRVAPRWNGLSGGFLFEPRGLQLRAPPKTDIWFEARGSGGNTKVAVDFELLLIEDGA